MSDDQVLAEISTAFSSVRKPKHFTNYTHCYECQEHDELLRSRDLASLQVEDVGNLGWDPLCFTSPEGLAYYFPALARLALQQPTPKYGWYAAQLLFHLTHQGAQNRHLVFFDHTQRDAVLKLLTHLRQTRSTLLDMYNAESDLTAALEIWSGGGI